MRGGKGGAEKGVLDLAGGGGAGDLGEDGDPAGLFVGREASGGVGP